MWHKALGELGEKVCELYPFLCKHYDDIGHFNFQCSSPNSYRSSTASLYCDDKITFNQHDELTLFLGCEEISIKISLVDMSDVDINSTLRGCRLYCVKDCLANTYIQNLIKYDVLQDMTGLIDASILLIERRNPPKFLLLFLSANQIMWRKCLSSLSLLKERVRRV
jgi:hypothetical protein